jgi:hypothetical protein
LYIWTTDIGQICRLQERKKGKTQNLEIKSQTQTTNFEKYPDVAVEKQKKKKMIG